jgi:hypothetical protein
MAKRKRTKGQTIYKAPHRKLKIEATRIPLTLGGGDPEVFAVPASHVTPVVLLLYDMNII